MGENTPMMAAEFYGFWPRVASVSDLRPIGRILDAHLDRFETRLAEMGYCGLLPDWRVVQAVDQARRQ